MDFHLTFEHEKNIWLRYLSNTYWQTGLELFKLHTSSSTFPLHWHPLLLEKIDLRNRYVALEEKRQCTTEAGKYWIYRILKLRYSNWTEPNNTEPNLIVEENKGSPCMVNFPLFIVFLCENFFKFVLFYCIFLA